MKKILFFLALFGAALAAEVSPQMYNELNKVGEQITKKDYAAAQTRLEFLLKNARRPVDRAYAYQTLGLLYLSKGDNAKALEALLKTKSYNALRNEKQVNLLLNIAQLYLMQKDYKKAKGVLTELLNSDPKKAIALYFLAQIYALEKNYAKSIELLESALANNPTPPNSWYELLFADYYETKNYPKALDVSKMLINKSPKEKKYWRFMLWVYFMQNDMKNATSALETAKFQGILDDKDLYMLANLLYTIKVPYKCAKVLELAVNKTYKENILHFQCLKAAREHKKALDLLTQIEKTSDDPRISLQKARLLFADYKLQDAVAAYKNAIKKGTDKKDDCLFEMSYCQYLLKHYKDAKQNLLAIKDKTLRQKSKELLEAIKKEST